MKTKTTHLILDSTIILLCVLILGLSYNVFGHILREKDAFYNLEASDLKEFALGTTIEHDPSPLMTDALDKMDDSEALDTESFTNACLSLGSEKFYAFPGYDFVGISTEVKLYPSGNGTDVDFVITAKGLSKEKKVIETDVESDYFAYSYYFEPSTGHCERRFRERNDAKGDMVPQELVDTVLENLPSHARRDRLIKNNRDELKTSWSKTDQGVNVFLHLEKFNKIEPNNIDIFHATIRLNQGVIESAEYTESVPQTF